MNNYEYIIASLPSLVRGAVIDTDATLAFIRGQLSSRDASALDLVLRAYSPEGPDAEFYTEALGSRSSFVRGYFKFDLGVRNTKAGYLNRALGRDPDKDTVCLGEEEFEQKARVEEILSGTDILGREHALDDLMWEQAEELTALRVFDLDVVLSFVVRLMIADRWMRLDEASGREMLRTLVDELRNSKNKI